MNMRLILRIGLAVFLSGIIIAAYVAPSLPRANSGQFSLPVTVSTYGNAWDGNLTFGLFQYGSGSLQPLQSYLVTMDTNGDPIYLRAYNDSVAGSSNPYSGGYGLLKYVSNGTIMFQGDPNQSTHFWNPITNQTTDFLNVEGYHHDIDYDPITGNFLVLMDYVRSVNGTQVLYDTIDELNSTGTVLWTWDTYNYLPLSWADPDGDTVTVNGQSVMDFTHCNAIQWDYQENVVYLNSRHLDTFFKINMTSGQIIWGCGLHGNFTLVNAEGSTVSSLWYGSHDTHEIAPNVFMMLDNDFHNLTKINDARSRILEVALNMQNMTATETWSWEAPQQYYSPFWGEADLLPNGDRIGTFGSNTKQYNSSLGAVIAEVSPSGQLVRTWTFPAGWGIYRAVVAPTTTSNQIPHLLLSVNPNLSSYSQSQTLILDVNVLNQGSSTLESAMTLTITGPAGYSYLDFQNINVTADTIGQFSFTWRIPNLSGIYYVEVSLIPLQLTAYDAQWLRVA